MKAQVCPIAFESRPGTRTGPAFCVYVFLGGPCLNRLQAGFSLGFVEQRPFFVGALYIFCNNLIIGHFLWGSWELNWPHVLERTWALVCASDSDMELGSVRMGRTTRVGWDSEEDAVLHGSLNLFLVFVGEGQLEKRHLRSSTQSQYRSQV